MTERTSFYMTKSIKIICLIIACLTYTSLAARPRVGIVLSGGGAKGTAHIGALKVIEEAGIPIDIIVGTSMGSIVGGLYAIGYTTEQLDSLVMAQDWKMLLSDKKAAKALDLITREQKSGYILSIPFFEKPQDGISGGVIKGRNIGRMLWELTEEYHDSINFRKLPIPFACVAQDLVSGKEVVFYNGVLPIAIRSSMSIPGVFAPVSLHGQLLIDGGLVNNYPVDIAKKMGADIIIGVDVQDPMKTEKEMQNNLIAQLSQLIDLQGRNRWEENVAQTDVYIKVDVKGYNTASFNTTAIDSLIERGEKAARLQMESLKTVSKKLQPDGKLLTTKKPPYYNIGLPHDKESEEQEVSLKTLIGNAPTNSINLGLRFDNEELATLLFNGNKLFGKERKHQVALTLRLGKQVYGDAHYLLNLGNKWNMTSGYRYTYNDFNINKKGEREFGISYNSHLVEFGFIRSWNNQRIKIGGIYQLYDYSSFLYRFGNEPPSDISKESYAKFGMQYAVNSLNDAYFPTKGNKLELEYYYALPTNHHKPFHIGALHWSMSHSFNSRFTLSPRIEGRYLTTENTVAETNSIGGQEAGKYFRQQIPFYGVTRIEMTQRALTVIGIEARQRIGAKHYVSAIFNVAAASDGWGRFFKKSFGGDDTVGYRIFGGAVRYDLRTFIGPVGFTLHFSDHSKVAGYIRAGFNF